MEYRHFGNGKIVGNISRFQYLGKAYKHIVFSLNLQMKESLGVSGGGGQGQQPISRSGSARSFNTTFGRAPQGAPGTPSPRPQRAHLGGGNANHNRKRLSKNRAEANVPVTPRHSFMLLAGWRYLH